MSKLKEIFGGYRIAGLPGEKDSGKTNNLVSLIVEYRKKRDDVPIYAYGMPKPVMIFLKKYGVKEISSLKHMVKKKNCFLIIDEFQKLKFNDRRYKDLIAEFVDFIYHKNVYVIFSTPNVREFNTVIGSIIERWLLKTIDIDNCVNGSQLKQKIDEYKGDYKHLGRIEVPKNEILIINDDVEKSVKCPYIQEADTKKETKDLF